MLPLFDSCFSSLPLSFLSFHSFIIHWVITKHSFMQKYKSTIGRKGGREGGGNVCQEQEEFRKWVRGRWVKEWSENEADGHCHRSININSSSNQLTEKTHNHRPDRRHFMFFFMLLPFFLCWQRLRRPKKIRQTSANFFNKHFWGVFLVEWGKKKVGRDPIFIKVSVSWRDHCNRKLFWSRKWWIRWGLFKWSCCF